MWRLLMLILLILPSLACAQTVTLPADQTAAPGDLIPLEVKFDGDDVRVKVTKGLTVFRVYDPDPKRYALMLYVPTKATDGTYEITAIATKAGKLGDFASCTVTVGGPTPFEKPKRAEYRLHFDNGGLASDNLYTDLSSAAKYARWLSGEVNSQVSVKDGEGRLIQSIHVTRR